MKKFKLNTILLLMFLMSSVATFAQDPGEIGGDPSDPDPTDAPISDYIWVVALLGLVYVFYKMKARQTKVA